MRRVLFILAIILIFNSISLAQEKMRVAIPEPAADGFPGRTALTVPDILRTESVKEGSENGWKWLSWEWPSMEEKRGTRGVSLSGSYLMPLGDFGDLLNPGYGVLASFFIRDIFIENLNGGIEGGYYTFSGNAAKVDSAYIIPVSLTVSYDIPLWKVALIPRISAGYSYNSIKYAESPYALYIEEYTEKTSLDPIAKVGLLIAFRFSRFGIIAGAEYGTIFENDGQLSFLTFLAGVEARFGI